MLGAGRSGIFEEILIWMDMLLNALLKDRKLILGSASPRRKELLAGLGVPFTVDANSNVKEEYDPKTMAEDVPGVLAVLKSDGFHRKLEDDEILITADTVVICGDHVLGKPADRVEAIGMLKLLSGRTHMVVTGVCIRSNREKHVFSASSEVTFRVLTDEEICYYVDNFSPYDKAGGYGIQEWIGYAGITGISGSYFNVMGLPVQKLYVELSDFLQNA